MKLAPIFIDIVNCNRVRTLFWTSEKDESPFDNEFCGIVLAKKIDIQMQKGPIWLLKLVISIFHFHLTYELKPIKSENSKRHSIMI